ncbi:MAG TPA: SUMF1/EgtB/PvdO family nonheme iron enzyme [Planctomycetota bacterium]|nr:SUMF1/EgtB/PvdO family nonheme iron enzyme [Planctomycetota bacterium]
MKSSGGLIFFLMLALCAAAQAVTIDWVTVGDAPNAPDDTGYGAVAYEYRIGRYEITNAQYREFLTNKAAVGDPNGLYNTDMAGAYGGISRSGSGTGGAPWVYAAKGGDANWNSRPVNYVSFWDIARFANWMNNGQGGGDTETGAYTGIGNQATFARQPGALFFIPTEDEWYKAAYYDPNKGVPGYWTYPTMSDSAPSNDLIDPDPGNNATYYNGDYTIGSPYWMTLVGAHENSESAYGTFDQGGNLWEWNETAIGSSRGLRGGSWLSLAISLSASFRFSSEPSDGYYDTGFRLAGSLESTEVPEPATVSLLGIAVAALLRRRRRRA